MGQAPSSSTSQTGDRNPDGAASSGGRGGTELVPEPKLGRYIYYRLYVSDGPLESINPVYSNDHFISRILSKSVAPPHTAASLKKYLCRIEGFEAVKKCALYLSLSEQTPVEDDTRLSLRGPSGPGLSEFEPIALVVDIRAADKRPPAATKTPLERFDETKIRYIYYRLYEENGEVVSKTSFDKTDSSLGRINTFSVPPPHTVAAFKAQLINAEKLSGRIFQLFEDGGGETALNDGGNITLHADTYPGASEEEPIAVVYTTQKETSISRPQLPVSQPQTQEPAAVVYPSRKKTGAQLLKAHTSYHPDQGFSMRIEAISKDVGGERDPRWHSVTAGEILHTDGILRTMTLPGLGPLNFYEAINSSGKKALIYEHKVKCC